MSAAFSLSVMNEIQLGRNEYSIPTMAVSPAYMYSRDVGPHLDRSSRLPVCGHDHQHLAIEPAGTVEFGDGQPSPVLHRIGGGQPDIGSHRFLHLDTRSMERR